MKALFPQVIVNCKQIILDKKRDSFHITYSKIYIQRCFNKLHTWHLSPITVTILPLSICCNNTQYTFNLIQNKLFTSSIRYFSNMD